MGTFKVGDNVQIKGGLPDHSGIGVLAVKEYASQKWIVKIKQGSNTYRYSVSEDELMHVDTPPAQSTPAPVDTAASGDAEQRYMIGSQLNLLSNEQLLARLDSLNNGYLRDELSVRHNRDEYNAVLTELGIRFANQLRQQPDTELDTLRQRVQELEALVKTVRDVPATFPFPKGWIMELKRKAAELLPRSS